jgi:NADPH-dependent curcumin reductase CurA
MENTRIVLAQRPQGEPTAADFRIESLPVPALAEGQVLVRHHFLSLDPYMRGRMSDQKSYAAPQPLDEVMIGGTVGVVEASKNAYFQAGDRVLGMGGWQEYAVVDASQRGVLQKLDARLPLSVYLGAVGMPGVTAWYGLTEIIAPVPGHTVAVSAATGAVGSVVGQLAKRRGARVVGIAGGPEKCAYATEVLGFDACLDHRALRSPKELGAALAAAAPSGIDGYFDNVGGGVLDAVMANANAFARIAVCGMIANYNGAPVPMANPQLILSSRLTLRGFIVSEHREAWPKALAELSQLAAEGQLAIRESVAQGIRSAPRAFIGMLRGENFGKQLVKLID